jgi:energy-coupling factor transporter transmembrane protein EcfT
MSLFQKFDLAVVVIANLLNLILTLIFLNRVFGRTEWEHWLGYGTLIMILPLTIIAVANLNEKRNWAFWVLPLVMVAYLVVEFVLDYWLKFNYRQTAWLGPYLLVYYVALFAMIGYAFLAGKTYGFITLITYFINLAATFYSYRQVGHGA